MLYRHSTYEGHIYSSVLIVNLVCKPSLIVTIICYMYSELFSGCHLLYLNTFIYSFNLQNVCYFLYVDIVDTTTQHLCWYSIQLLHIFIFLYRSILGADTPTVHSPGDSRLVRQICLNLIKEAGGDPTKKFNEILDRYKSIRSLIGSSPVEETSIQLFAINLETLRSW